MAPFINVFYLDPALQAPDQLRTYYPNHGSLRMHHTGLLKLNTRGEISAKLMLQIPQANFSENRYSFFPLPEQGRRNRIWRAQVTYRLLLFRR